MSKLPQGLPEQEALHEVSQHILKASAASQRSRMILYMDHPELDNDGLKESARLYVQTVNELNRRTPGYASRIASALSPKCLWDWD